MAESARERANRLLDCINWPDRFFDEDEATRLLAEWDTELQREARLTALREAGDHLIATANQYGADAVKHAKIGLKGSAETCSYLEEAFVKSANEVFRLIAPAASTSSVGAERTGTALPVDAYVNDELCMCRNCQVRRATTQTKEGKDAE